MLALTRRALAPHPTNGGNGGMPAPPRPQAMHYRNPDFIPPLVVRKEGVDILKDALYNKGTGYTVDERERLHIRGLVPPRVFTLEEQVHRVYRRFTRIDSDLEKFIYMSDLQDRNETLYYHVLCENIVEMSRIVYTPTIGQACLKFGSQFRRPRGMYFGSNDRGSMQAMVHNWPAREVDVIVVTDGSRILGLGDLGAHGMGVPIGKLSLYVACAGIHPARCMPVLLDPGTDNPVLLHDPLYIGEQHPRLTGEEYMQFVEEFIVAVTTRWPNVMIQFEDFQTRHALPLLRKYRDKVCCFNDDISGTGAVVLAGVFSALRSLGLSGQLSNQRIVCVGAGSAGLGVSEALVMGMRDELNAQGQSNKNPYDCFYLLDDRGLLGRERMNQCDPAQAPFVRKDLPSGMSLLETIESVKPTILLGLSGVGGVFTEEVVRAMAKHNTRPIIFPLSNPTSRSECTPDDAYRWTDGRAIVATGSPFPQTVMNGVTLTPSQMNNMYVFPGVGLGAVISRTRSITDQMFGKVALRLSELVSQEERAAGLLFPQLSRIRDVSSELARVVAEEAFDHGLAQVQRPSDLREYIQRRQYVPLYAPLVPAVGKFALD